MQAPFRIILFIFFIGFSISSFAQNKKSTDEKAAAEAKEREKANADSKNKKVVKKFEGEKGNNGVSAGNNTAASSFAVNAYKQINAKHVSWVKITSKKIAKIDMNLAQIKEMVNAYGQTEGLNKSGMDGLVILVLQESYNELKKENTRVLLNIDTYIDKKNALENIKKLLADKDHQFSAIQLDSINYIIDSYSYLDETLMPETEMPIAKKGEAQELSEGIQKANPIPLTAIMVTKHKVNAKIEELNEFSQLETVRLQQLLQTQNRRLTMLSNMMKQVKESEQAIIQNLK